MPFDGKRMIYGGFETLLEMYEDFPRLRGRVRLS